MKIKEFFKPTFTTGEFENAKTRDGQKPEITSMELGEVIGSPKKVYGKITLNKMQVKAEWNQFGECQKYYPTERCRKWDLIHPDNAEIASAKEYFFGVVAFVIMLAIFGIFNTK
jgi:hypothetical protein